MERRDDRVRDARTSGRLPDILAKSRHVRLSFTPDGRSLEPEESEQSVRFAEKRALPTQMSLAMLGSKFGAHVSDTDVRVTVLELPWRDGVATWMKLSPQADVFVTHDLSGCLVLVGGSPHSPTVVHGSGTIPADDLVAAVAAKGLYPDGDFRVFDSTPARERLGCFFGVRDGATGWRFYGQSLPDVTTEMLLCDTRCLWPDDVGLVS